MKNHENKVFKIIPVRFEERDLRQLQTEAAALRLSIAALVRMKIAATLQPNQRTVQA